MKKKEEDPKFKKIKNIIKIILILYIIINRIYALFIMKG